MARPSNKDPLEKFRWSVSIDGFTRSGFTMVEVPKMTINTQSYAEGGSHFYPRQIVDTVQYKPITLMRGATTDKSFIEWAKSPAQLVESSVLQPISFGKGIFSSPEPEVRAGDYRRDVLISHMDRAGREVRQYILYKAFPIEYEPASDFSADSDDTYSMEKLVLAYESFEVVTSTADSNPFSVKDVIKRLLRRTF